MRSIFCLLVCSLLVGGLSIAHAQEPPQTPEFDPSTSATEDDLSQDIDAPAYGSEMGFDEPTSLLDDSSVSAGEGMDLPLTDLPELIEQDFEDLSEGMLMDQPMDSEMDPSNNVMAIEPNQDFVFEGGPDGELADAPIENPAEIELPELELSTSDAISDGGVSVGEFGSFTGDDDLAFGRLKFQIGDVFGGTNLQIGAEVNDNTFGSETNRETSITLSATPRFFLAYGDYLQPTGNRLRVNYAPSFKFYIENPDLNRVDQRFLLDGQLVFQKLEIRSEISYISFAAVDADIGGRVAQNNLNASLRLNYEITPKISITLTPRASFQTYDDTGKNNADYSLRASVNYRIQPKLTVGFGGGLGMSNVQGADAQPFQSFSLNLAYDSSAKLQFFVRAGAQRRTLQQNGETTQRIAASLESGLRYLPTPFTEIEMSLDSGLRNSGAGGTSTFVETALVGRIAQKIGDRVTARLFTILNNDNYGEDSGVNSGRNDNQVVFRPEIEFVIRGGYNISLYYQYRQNISNFENRSFDQNILGTEITIRF